MSVFLKVHKLHIPCLPTAFTEIWQLCVRNTDLVLTGETLHRGRGWLTSTWTVCWWPPCLGNLFASFIPFLPHLVIPDQPFAMPPPPPLQPRISLPQSPFLSVPWAAVTPCPWLFAYTPAPWPWGSFKGQGGAVCPSCSHLTSLLQTWERCSFRPAVKVALGYGYISDKNWCEVANSFTKTRKELKSCCMLKASSQY